MRFRGSHRHCIDNAAPQGFVEGQLKIISLRPVELDGENRRRRKPRRRRRRIMLNYPLIVLSHGEKKQVARITADARGHYRAALPPGAYILDAEGRVRKRLHVRAQPFTIVPNETVHVDMTIDTGFAAEAQRAAGIARAVFGRARHGGFRSAR